MSKFRQSGSVSLVSPHVRKKQALTQRARTLARKPAPRALVRTGTKDRPVPKKRLRSRIGSVLGKAGYVGGIGMELNKSRTTYEYEDSYDFPDTTPLAKRGIRRITAPGKRTATKAGVTATKRTMRRAGTHQLNPLARAAANAGRAMAVVVKKLLAVAVLQATPLLLIGMVVLIVLAAIVSILPSFIIGYEEETKAAQANMLGANVPAQYAAYVLEAGTICAEVTPSIIAAQIEAESGWNPNAVSPVGAQGISQFMPSTWLSVGRDGDGDGIADPFNAADAIITQGHYMCGQVDAIEKHFGTRDLDLALAAYNAGLGSVLSFGGIPPFPETMNYVARINELATTKYAVIGAIGATGYIGDDYPWASQVRTGTGAAGGLYNTPNFFTNFYYGNCTDFVFWRVNRDMGVTFTGATTQWALSFLDLTPQGGNGYQWGKPGNLPGWTTITNAADALPGDVISYERGVFGSSATYGHVAYIAQVSNGQILVENYGTGQYWTRTHDASALQSYLNSGQVVIKRNPALGG
ncbi:MAG: transglycosylase SLT domain-containing protein [Arcanobacterium sp.]